MKEGNVNSAINQVADDVVARVEAREQAVTAGVANIEHVVETWFHDLIQSVPELRETEVFNKVRGAVTELKKRIS